MLDFACIEALFSEFEFDCRVVECGEFVVRGLHDFEFGYESLCAAFLASECRPERAEFVGGCIECGSPLDAREAP